MEAPVFLLFCLSVGYLIYWTVVNDKRSPNGGHDGWFAIRPTPDANTPARSENPQRQARPNRR